MMRRDNPTAAALAALEARVDQAVARLDEQAWAERKRSRTDTVDGLLEIRAILRPPEREYAA
jgi:hypothetical protein